MSSTFGFSGVAFVGSSAPSAFILTANFADVLLVSAAATHSYSLNAINVVTAVYYSSMKYSSQLKTYNVCSNTDQNRVLSTMHDRNTYKLHICKIRIKKAENKFLW